MQTSSPNTLPGRSLTRRFETRRGRVDLVHHARKFVERRAQVYRYHLEYAINLLGRLATCTEIVAPTRMHRIPADPRQATAHLQRLEQLWNAGRISETEYLEQREKIEDSLTGEDWGQSVQHPAR